MYLTYSEYRAGHFDTGQKHQSLSIMWRPDTTHMGRASLWREGEREEGVESGKGERERGMRRGGREREKR